MHGLIFVPPGTSPAVQARGWGIVSSGLVPGVGGWGKSKI